MVDHGRAFRIRGQENLGFRSVRFSRETIIPWKRFGNWGWQLKDSRDGLKLDLQKN